MEIADTVTLLKWWRHFSALPTLLFGLLMLGASLLAADKPTAQSRSLTRSSMAAALPPAAPPLAFPETLDTPTTAPIATTTHTPTPVVPPTPPTPHTQGEVNAAALAVANTLAASVVLSGSVGTYLTTNQDITSRTLQMLGQSTYSITLDYGIYISPTAIYSWTLAAGYSNGSWQYTQPYYPSALVPSSIDAVRITSGYAAAAALQGVPGYVPQGPTWPFTGLASPTLDPNSGICNPVLLWQPWGGSGSWRNLVQLGAHQGCSWEAAPCGSGNGHLQLLTEPDTRPAQPEATGGYNPCPGYTAAWAGLWSPGGNCTDPTISPPPYGDVCCAVGDSVADIDIANFVTHDFTGRISLTATAWWDSGESRNNPPTHDWRSANAIANNIRGDWVEVYRGGNLGYNIVNYVREYIGVHGVPDGLAPYYGNYIDKIMYRYDVAERWEPLPGTCDPSPCPFAWQPANILDPHRVHMAQSFVFRTYYLMASAGGFDTPAEHCGTSQHYHSSSQLYGVYAGAIVTTPPPSPTGHGLYNYVGLISPSSATPTRTTTQTNTPTITRTPTVAPTTTSILIGHVAWQGRPDQPHPLQQLPISITLTFGLGGQQVHYPSQTTDAGGFFTISVGSLANGIYSWRAKGPHSTPHTNTSPGFLATSGSVELTGAPITNLEVGEVNAGDADNDNTVNVLDFNLLRSTFGLTSGNPGYDGRADFNGDNTVDVLDFNLLKNNFGLSGDLLARRTADPG